MKKVLYRWITGVLLAGWMLGIFMFSAQPAVASDKMSGSVAYRVVELCDQMFHMEWIETELEDYARDINYPIRKAAHMTEYAALGILVFFCLIGYERCKKKVYWLALILAFFYAATDEVHQLFVAGRAGRFSDVCIDTAGAAIGLLFIYIVRKIIGKHCEKKKLPLQ